MSTFTSLKNYLRDSRYCIGFIKDYNVFDKFDYKKIHWLDLNGYKDGWFADPFIFESNEQKFTVLAEEWYYPINHGRISKLTIDRKSFELLEVKPLLQLETHLSFPLIVRENGTVYICPENYQSGAVSIYEYDVEADRLTNPVKLIDKPLLDVQILNNNGVYYLMGVEYVTGEQIDTCKLQIFTSEHLLGPYEQRQVITSDHCDKRGAGLIFRYNDKVIRPSQCCDNNEYGTAVIFNEITFEGEIFAEKENQRITRCKRKHNGMVLHSFNQLDGLTAIDGWDYTHRYIGRFVEYLRKNIRKFINS